MTRRKKTDGERSAYEVLSGRYQGMACPTEIAAEIDRLIRRRMAEAWEEGWFDRDCQEADWYENPYRERTEK